MKQIDLMFLISKFASRLHASYKQVRHIPYTRITDFFFNKLVRIWFRGKSGKGGKPNPNEGSVKLMRI